MKLDDFNNPPRLKSWREDETPWPIRKTVGLTLARVLFFGIMAALMVLLMLWL